jgi:hypothetical protein
VLSRPRPSPRLAETKRRGLIAAEPPGRYIFTMDTIRMAERLSEGGIFTEEQARRIATTLADHLKDELATKHDLLVLKAELEAKLTAALASVRNQLLTAQVAAFFGIILYITFKL